MPMGPVELVDQVGIDVGYKVAHILQDAFGERMKVAHLLETVKEEGLLGRKSGRGFYLYEKGKKTVVNPDIAKLEKTDVNIGVEDVLKRLIYIMINEAARCLEEKVVDEPSTVDIGMIMGTGFPPFRGGLLHYADSIGTRQIVSDLQDFAVNLSSERFKPSPYLKQLAEQNRGFYK